MLEDQQEILGLQRLIKPLVGLCQDMDMVCTLMFIATHIHNLESQFLEEIAAALCLLFTSDILLVEVTLKENLLHQLGNRYSQR